MIPTTVRESKRMKRTVKLPKNLERAYREYNCQECTVVVTPMDFARILGKFTKVKIQYESNATPKSKRGYNQGSAFSRLKSNENGLVQGTKKSKPETSHAPILNNILRENNKIKKTYSRKTNNDYNDTRIDYKLDSSKIKHYGIVFENPIVKKKKNDFKSTISLQDLIPHISDSILPSENWSIDYFPKNGEPKDDKVYDRIAAELEDLMCSEKISNVTGKDDKSDDFPSIMDILNDNPKFNEKNYPNTVTLESNDVEAILLGTGDQSKPTPMDIDNTDVSSFLTGVTPITKEQTQNRDIMDESPDSPSILDENTQKESEPLTQSNQDLPKETKDNKTPSKMNLRSKIDVNENTNADNKNKAKVARTGVNQVIFKKNVKGTCQKTVICPKNLKFNISMFSKSVELLGAPKVITSLEDLQVLLQIVDESNLDSIYVLH